MADESSSTGWYPYPGRPGVERYWDGTDWTEEREAPESTWAPPPTPPGGRAADRPPWFRRSGTLVGIGALLAVVAVGAAVAFGGGSMPTIPSVSESEATATPTHTASATPTAEPTAAPGVARSEYETLTAWEFQQLFNDPAAHKGERFVVYGQADELDQAGGGFLARIGPERQTSGSNYDSEVMLSADSDASFSEVSEDDLLTMWVQVAGGSRVATNPPPSDDEEDEEDGDKSPPPPPLPLLSVDLVEVDGS